MKNLVIIAVLILSGLLIASNAADQRPVKMPRMVSTPSIPSTSSNISMTSSDNGRVAYLSFTIYDGPNLDIVIFRTTDQGRTWRRVPSIDIHWLGESNTPNQK
ncbi:MAG: hypothetical protein GY869_21300 [Planctomycetes bacterium]|nr:hypothetical protein [Planctomycetota bacterium]